ncbi:SusC/RagA family TonB-linked outer membrane protein [Pedobacter sp. HMWF019]|uniref:TonB-dependent receptor n=1 Tax=Pedobacter sp. HMWF019 TaxID=2056856 RepID=UPI000D34F7E8|nr:TonB-dependent receptor [Pedobacter sp. HMWF019]PTS95367.1 SusC/RagA family TonB-linked outer membrane protein [Pedobacter sp. HMWF019]
MKDCIQTETGIPVPGLNQPLKSRPYAFKAFLVMKFTALIIFCFSMQMSAATMAQRVSLNTSNTSLKEIFREVRKQTSYYFIYNSEVLEKANPVTINVKNLALEELLEKIFSTQPLVYSIEDHTIVVSAKSDLPRADRMISGLVTGKDDGLPLPGVSVRVKGKTGGVTTDRDGKYSINLPGTFQTLIFSYIGYANLEVTVGAGNTLNVQLAVENKQLEEVVVQAYGSIRKNALTNAVSTINARDLENRQMSNIATALVGAAPGIQTTTGSGQPGSGPSIRIRGFGSINGGVDPLYVVDGAPFPESGLNNLNPDDIESISVLKDASASALYGSRAANGVILITTKKGKNSPPSIDFKTTQGLNSRALSDYEKVDAFQYYPLLWESMRNSLVSKGSTLTAANDAASAGIAAALVYNPFNVDDKQVVLPDGRINPAASLLYADDLDWRKALRRTGLRSEYNLNYKGGSSKSDYYASLSYLKDEGYSVLTDFNRYNGRVNLNSQVKDWIKTGINLSASVQKTKIGNEDSGIWENPFYTDLIFAPIYPVYKHDAAGAYQLDALGNKVYDEGYTRPIAPGRNVLAETEYNDNFNEKNYISGRTYIELSFLKNFKFTTNLSLDLNNVKLNVFDNPTIGDGVTYNGRSNRTNTGSRSINLNQLLNYNRTFGRHNLDVLAGHEAYQYRYNYNFASAGGQIVSGSTELKNFANILSLTSYEDNYRIESYFGRIQYDFDGRYFASASYRTDASSRFAASNRWGKFWSVGAGWQINKEQFFKADWVDNLKLRASYGQVGSDDLGSYYLYQTFYDTGYKNGSEAGVKQSLTLGNDKIQWESNNNMDIALEFGVLKNRISGHVEYFNRYTDNLLFLVPLAISSGLTSKNENFGSLYNRGAEVQLDLVPVRNRNFKWNLGLNWTKLTNKIAKLPFEEYIDGTKKYMVGHSRYDYWLRQWYGVDPSTGSELFVAADPAAADSFKTADGTAVTTNGSNALFHYAGSAIPNFFGSISNTFTYKNFSLDIRFIYQVGGKAFDNDYESLMLNGTYGRALHVDALNRWQNPGDVTNVPRRNIGDTMYDSDRWLIDASYLYLRSANLSYALPDDFSKKLGIHNVKVFASGENLFMNSKRKGFDASQAYNGNSSYTYAPTRIISLGINVTL